MLKIKHIAIAMLALGAASLSSCSGGSHDSFQVDFYPVGKCYLGANGEILKVDHLFENEAYKLHKFCDGLALVQADYSNEKYFINGKGEVAIDLTDPDIREVSGFSEGVAFYYSTKYCFTAIDKEGNTLFETDLRPITPYHDGVCLVEDSEHNIGSIDKKGNVVLEPSPDRDIYITGAFDGRSGLVPFSEDNLYGVMDYKGNVVVPPIIEDIITFIFNKDRFLVVTDIYGGEKKLIDSKGNELASSKEYPGLSPDCDLIVFYEGRSQGWLDLDGKVIVEPIVGSDAQFNGMDVTPVQLNRDNGYENVLINRKGEIVGNLDYKPVSGGTFHQGVYIGEIRGGYTVLNNKNDIITEGGRRIETADFRIILNPYLAWNPKYPF